MLYTRAWITGGSSGIGLALARLLVADGTSVALLARDLDRLEAARRTLEPSLQGDAQTHAVRCDVTDPTSVQSAITQLETTLPDPDLVAHVAGTAWPCEFSDLTAEAFDRTLRVNLYGTFHVARAVVPILERTRGRLLNVSSLAGLMGVYGLADYCAAKFGVVGFSEALRQELEPRGISVHVLCPPDTDTPGLAAENEIKPAVTRALSENASELSPGVVARAALRGMARGRFLIVPGTSAKLTHLAQRWVPSIVQRVMRGMIAKARAKP